LKHLLVTKQLGAWITSHSNFARDQQIISVQMVMKNGKKYNELRISLAYTKKS